MKVGDVVVLNSGSHLMTVCSITDPPRDSTLRDALGGGKIATCAWHAQDVSGLPTVLTESFPVACLCKVMLHEGVVH